ncbi:hypothetical protein F5Y16DRAFT_419446 [Xylariaceae sp. FL0255]|nr:hypothetical protein F5Y16DRAFT_419446 [Xylariaceae sp. FL0255]
MSSKEIEYQPLKSASDENESVHDGLRQHYTENTKKQHWYTALWVLCLLTLVVSNGIWFSVYQTYKSSWDRASHEFPVLSPHVFNTPYTQSNLSTMNILWEELFPTGAGAVKVDPQWAVHHGLLRTQGYASDGKAIYVVAAYHQLHCVAVLRASLYQFHNGFDQVAPWAHITHCIDALRQAVQCLADPTLGGVSSMHECRDFEALKTWVLENEYTEFLVDIIDANT